MTGITKNFKNAALISQKLLLFWCFCNLRWFFFLFLLFFFVFYLENFFLVMRTESTYFSASAWPANTCFLVTNEEKSFTNLGHKNYCNFPFASSYVKRDLGIFYFSYDGSRIFSLLTFEFVLCKRNMLKKIRLPLLGFRLWQSDFFFFWMIVN